MATKELIDDEEYEKAYALAREELRKEVIEQIRKAFATTEYPGDDKIFEWIRGDDLDFVEAFDGHTWQELSTDTVHRHSSDIYLLSAEGFRYYLPAYLLVGIQIIFCNMVPETLENTLTPPPYSRVIKEAEWFLERIEPLTLEQKQAVLTYLEFQNEASPDIERQSVQALTHYWRQFEGEELSIRFREGANDYG